MPYHSINSYTMPKNYQQSNNNNQQKNNQKVHQKFYLKHMIKIQINNQIKNNIRNLCILWRKLANSMKILIVRKIINKRIRRICDKQGQELMNIYAAIQCYVLSYISIYRTILIICILYIVYCILYYLYIFVQQINKIINIQRIISLKSTIVEMDNIAEPNNEHQNQFEQISAIVPHHQTTTHFQHDIDISLADDDPTKSPPSDKFTYYQNLCKQNKQMYRQLQQFDKKLTKQIKQLHRPNKPKQKNKQTTIDSTGNKNIGKDKIISIYKIQTKLSNNIQNKYKQLDMYKKQLQQKLRNKAEIITLKYQYQKLKSMYKQQYQQLEIKNRNLSKLTTLLHNKQFQQPKLSNYSMIFQDVYKMEIKELKQKIKEKTVKIYEQKQKYIEHAKNNIKKFNNSVTDLNKSNNMEEQQTAVVMELRMKYQAIGNRIQLLKMQKKVLSESQVGLDQRKKYLFKLKAKLTELTKL